MVVLTVGQTQMEMDTNTNSYKFLKTEFNQFTKYSGN